MPIDLNLINTVNQDVGVQVKNLYSWLPNNYTQMPIQIWELWAILTDIFFTVSLLTILFLANKRNSVLLLLSGCKFHLCLWFFEKNVGLKNMINTNFQWKHKELEYACFYTESLLCTLPQNARCCLLGNYMKQRARLSFEELNSLYHLIQRSNSFLKKPFFLSLHISYPSFLERRNHLLPSTPFQPNPLNLGEVGSCSLSGSLAAGVLAVFSSLLWVL